MREEFSSGSLPIGLSLCGRLRTMAHEKERDKRWKTSKYRHKREETPPWAKRVVVRRCSVCGINKPVWSNKGGITTYTIGKCI